MSNLDFEVLKIETQKMNEINFKKELNSIYGKESEDVNSN